MYELRNFRSEGGRWDTDGELQHVRCQAALNAARQVGVPEDQAQLLMGAFDKLYRQYLRVEVDRPKVTDPYHAEYGMPRDLTPEEAAAITHPDSHLPDSDHQS